MAYAPHPNARGNQQALLETPPPPVDPAFADRMPVRYWPAWHEDFQGAFRDTETASRPWVDDRGEFRIMVILDGRPEWVPLYKVARLPVDPSKDGPRHTVRLPPWRLKVR